MQGTLLFACFVCLAAAAIGEPNCAPQPSGYQAVKNCCRMPEPNLKTLPGDCLSKKPTGPPSPEDKWCVVECIFKASNILNGYELNMPAVRTMCDTIYKDAPEFAEAFYKSFDECGPIIKTEVDLYKASSSTPPAFKCSPLPSAYVNCVHMKMLQHCPVMAWQANDSCAASRAYVTNCQKEIIEQGRKKWTEAAKNPAAMNE